MTTNETARPHAHLWIDPLDPPIARDSYSPVIGAMRREMKPGRTYVCQRCHATLTTARAAPPPPPDEG